MFLTGILSVFRCFSLFFNQRLPDDLLERIVYLCPLLLQFIISLKMGNMVQFVGNVCTHEQCVIRQRTVRAFIVEYFPKFRLVD